MKVVIRNALPKDTASIAVLVTQLGYKSNDKLIKNRLIEILNRSDHCVCVALENKKIVGWIHAFYSLRIESDAFIEIGGLVVDKEHRNYGVGKMLVEKIIEWSVSKNIKKVRVRCNLLRKESHVFYDKIGFQLQKEQKIFDKKVF